MNIYKYHKIKVMLIKKMCSLKHLENQIYDIGMMRIDVLNNYCVVVPIITKSSK